MLRRITIAGLYQAVCEHCQLDTYTGPSSTARRSEFISCHVIQWSVSTAPTACINIALLIVKPRLDPISTYPPLESSAYTSTSACEVISKTIFTLYVQHLPFQKSLETFSSFESSLLACSCAFSVLFSISRLCLATSSLCSSLLGALSFRIFGCAPLTD